MAILALPLCFKNVLGNIASLGHLLYINVMSVRSSRCLSSIASQYGLGRDCSVVTQLFASCATNFTRPGVS